MTLVLVQRQHRLVAEIVVLELGLVLLSSFLRISSLDCEAYDLEDLELGNHGLLLGAVWVVFLLACLVLA